MIRLTAQQRARNKNPAENFSEADEEALRFGNLRKLGDAVCGEDSNQLVAPVGRWIAPDIINVAHGVSPKNRTDAPCSVTSATRLIYRTSIPAGLRGSDLGCAASACMNVAQSAAR
jgi:hypothetical protein